MHDRTARPHTLALALGALLAPALAHAEASAVELDRVEVREAPEQPRARPARSSSRLDLPVAQQPFSADVIDQQALRARGDTRFIDALDMAPGVVPAYSFGVINISGRGFSGVFNSPTLFDGIRYPGWQVSPRLTLNYAQVEVLRGPAALTAGQGSVAGAINLVPRRADGRSSTDVFLGLGRFGTTTAAVGSGGALGSEALAWRLDASHQQSAERGSFGYARDTSFEFRHLNAELAGRPTDSLRLSLSMEHFRDDAEGYFGSPLIEGRVLPALRDVNYNVVDDAIDMEVDWLRARAEWEPSDAFRASLVLFGNREDRLYRNAEVYAFEPVTRQLRRGDYLFITHDQKLRGAVAEASWTHSLFGLPHQLVVGAQADRNDHDRSSDSPFRYSDRVPLQPEARGVFTSLDVFGPRTATDIRQRSLFVESALTLSPRWLLVSGLRHDGTDVESFNALSGVSFGRRYSAPTYRLGAVFEASPQTRWYASYATSSEAPAQITTLGLGNADFDLTDSQQLEVGIKHGGPIADWTLALYDLRRSNLLSRDPDDPNRLLQVGEQGSRGIEASFELRLGERLRLQGSAAALDARFLRFDQLVAGQLVSFRGNDPVAAPERVGTLWAHWQLREDFDVALGARGVGRSAANIGNTLYVPGYGTLDALLRYRSRFGQFSLRLRNLADRTYATRPYGSTQFMLGEPRWYELNWQHRF
ncbi:MAG: TonB-dependent receptor [Aquimonas sp.]|nr:TonB-dependent receptor [Aquimonas sp.]